MTKYRSAAGIAAAAVLGLVLIPVSDVVGGAIIGAAMTAMVALVVQRRQSDARRTILSTQAATNRAERTRLEAEAFRLRAAEREVAAFRRKYEAAWNTLAPQRERMRLNMEERLVSEIASLNARHTTELVKARSAGFEDGVRALLLGQLGDPGDEAATTNADVIDLLSHRR